MPLHHLRRMVNQIKTAPNGNNLPTFRNKASPLSRSFMSLNFAYQLLCDHLNDKRGELSQITHSRQIKRLAKILSGVPSKPNNEDDKDAPEGLSPLDSGLLSLGPHAHIIPEGKEREYQPRNDKHANPNQNKW